MRDHVRIRKEYVRLVRARKLDEAQKILEKIWCRGKKKSPEIVSVVESIKEKTITPKVDSKEQDNSVKYKSLDELTKINGIGEKTVSDIKIMFGNLDDLKNALNENRVALRDDIVEKLRGEFI